MDELNTVIAQNIVSLRTSAKMTQAELADALNYSDKAISKWERAASVPDISVLKRIADMFGVTVDYLITEHENASPLQKEDFKKKRDNRIIMVSFFGIWLAAVIALSILWMLKIPNFWLSLIGALPVSSLVVFILLCSFSRKKEIFWSISVLTWSFLASVYIFLLILLPKGENNFWQIFLIGIPAEIVEYISCTFKGKDAWRIGKEVIKNITQKKNEKDGK